MSLDQPAPDEVVALRYDEVAVAEDLANWCRGTLEVLTSSEGDPLPPVIWVPTGREPRAAKLGDWIVLTPDGTYTAMTAEAFAARYEPAELAAHG